MSTTHGVIVRSRRVVTAARARAMGAAWGCDLRMLQAMFAGGDVVALTLTVTSLGPDSVCVQEATEVARLLVHQHDEFAAMVVRLPSLFDQDWTLTPEHACFAFSTPGPGELEVLVPLELAPPARLKRWEAYAWPGRIDACLCIFPPPAGAPCFDGGAELQPHADGEDFALAHATLAPDGAQLATGGEHGTVALWRTADLGEVCRRTEEFEEDGDPSPYVQFSSDGAQLAWTSLDGGGLRMLSGPGGAVRRVPGDFYRYAFCRDGCTLVAQVGAVDLMLVDVATGESLRSLAPGSGGEDVTEFVVARGVDLVAVATRGQQVRVQALPGGETLWAAPLPASEGSPPALAFNRSGDRLAVSRQDGVVTIHDARTGAVMVEISTAREMTAGVTMNVMSVDFSPDGEYLAAAICEVYAKASLFHVWIFRVADGVVLRKLGAPARAVQRVEFAPGPLLLAQGYDHVTLYRPVVDV